MRNIVEGGNMAAGTTSAKQTWRQTVWWLRKARRWSQERLAKEIQDKNRVANYGLPENRGHIKRTIQHWEAGDSLPSDEYSVLLVLVFALPEELIDGSLVSGSELDRLMRAYEAMGYHMDRRRFLLSAAALTTLGRDAFAGWSGDGGARIDYVLRHPRTVDLGTVTELSAQLQDLSKRYDSAPSTSLLAAVGQCHGRVPFLWEHAPDRQVRQALSVLKIQSATLMGQLVWDASQRRDHETALAYYDDAISVAREIKNVTSEAYAGLRKSFVALYGKQHPREGLLLARDAATLVSGGASHTLAGLALLHVGEAHAMLGERYSCEKALGDAESHYSKVEITDRNCSGPCRSW